MLQASTRREKPGRRATRLPSANKRRRRGRGKAKATRAVHAHMLLHGVRHPLLLPLAALRAILHGFCP